MREACFERRYEGQFRMLTGRLGEGGEGDRNMEDIQTWGRNVSEEKRMRSQRFHAIWECVEL